MNAAVSRRWRLAAIVVLALVYIVDALGAFEEIAL